MNNQALIISDESVDRLITDCNIKNGDPEIMKKALYSLSKKTQDNIINYYENNVLPADMEEEHAKSYIKDKALSALRKNYGRVTGFHFDKDSGNYQKGFKNFMRYLYNYMRTSKDHDFSWATTLDYTDFYKFFFPVVEQIINNIAPDDKEILAVRYGFLDGLPKAPKQINEYLSFDASDSKVRDADKRVFRSLVSPMHRHVIDNRKTYFQGYTPTSEARLIDIELRSSKGTPATEDRLIEKEEINRIR